MKSQCELEVNDFSQNLGSVDFLFINMGRKVNGKFNEVCRVVVCGSISCEEKQK